MGRLGSSARENSTDGDLLLRLKPPSAVFYFFLGASIGTLVIFTLAGLLADGLGWPAVFYVTGNRGFQFDLLGTGNPEVFLFYRRLQSSLGLCLVPLGVGFTGAASTHI